MITQRAYNYAKVLYSLGIKEEKVQNTKKLLTSCSELMDILENPAIQKKEKAAVIDALFDPELTIFMKILCENEVMGDFMDIMEAYEEQVLEHKNILKAKLSYAVKPDEYQLEEIKEMLCKKYDKAGILLELFEDQSLLGGYVLQVGTKEYDKSIKGVLKQMQLALSGR